MRIAMVSEHASPLASIGGVDAGGQNVHVAALSTALGRRGHEVVVYTRRDDPALPERVAFAPGVEVVHVTAGPEHGVPKDDLLPWIPALAAGIGDDWQAHGVPDVVHGHFWMSGLACLDAVKTVRPPALRPPVLQTFHALGSVKRRYLGADDTSPRERAWLEPAVVRRVDRIIATCPDEVTELTALGADPDRVSVAPCGVDLALFGDASTREPTNGRRRIAAIGRLVRRKGVDLVISALATLRDEGVDDVELHIVGGPSGSNALADDPEAQRLHAVAAELGVLDRVVFRGQIPQTQMPAMLRSCTAVVCCPWYEPFGIVPLEAMACRVPVVVAAVGGLQESVRDSITGMHVPPRDPDAIAAALRRLLDDPTERDRMGEAGRLRVETGYSWDHVAELTEDAYLLALNEPEGTAYPQVVLPAVGGMTT